MKKRPIFQFGTEAETGIDKVPVGSIVCIENYATTGTVLFTKQNNTGVTTATTLAQAIASGNLKNTLPPATATTFGGVKASLSGSVLTLNF